MFYLDTAYTERYMRFASTGDNFQGYDVRISHKTTLKTFNLITLFNQIT